MRPRKLSDYAIVLHDRDDVATALTDMPSGAYVRDRAEGASTIVLAEEIPAGFKLALRPIRAGEKIHKYGYPIGVAQAEIAPGECVHVHNLRSAAVQ